jgi:hypothetical protein
MANDSIRRIEDSVTIPKRFVDLAASGCRGKHGSAPIGAAQNERNLSIS